MPSHNNSEYRKYPDCGSVFIFHFFNNFLIMEKSPTNLSFFISISYGSLLPTALPQATCHFPVSCVIGRASFWCLPPDTICHLVSKLSLP